MVRSSSWTIRCTSAAISGGIEKEMTFDFLGVVILSFCSSLYYNIILVS